MYINYIQIGTALMERFEGAFQMTFRNNNSKVSKKKLVVIDRHMKKPTKKDLVYIDDSLNFCERNQT